MTKGFTLIELMVASAILVILVLIMSTIFHQSSVAWDGGTRKAEGSMMARAVLGFMAREMLHAVVDTEYLGPVDIRDGWNSITFTTLSGTNSSSERIARKITYSIGGGIITRLEQVMVAGPGYGGSWSGTPNPLAEDVASLMFYTSSGMNHTTNLPMWVQIELGVEREEDISGIGVRSFGPDRDPDTADDIRSW